MPETKLQAIERILRRAEHRLASIGDDQVGRMGDDRIKEFRLAQGDVSEAIKVATPQLIGASLSGTLHSLAVAQEAGRRADHMTTAARGELGSVHVHAEDRGVMEAKLDMATACIDRAAVHLSTARDALDKAIALAGEL